MTQPHHPIPDLGRAAAQVEVVARQMMRQTLKRWAKRWGITFPVIALLVYLFPGLSWLWWPAIFIAAFTPLLLLGGALLLRSKVGAVQRSTGIVEASFDEPPRRATPDPAQHGDDPPRVIEAHFDDD